jgi:hypothetical protein
MKFSVEFTSVADLHSQLAEIVNDLSVEGAPLEFSTRAGAVNTAPAIDPTTGLPKRGRGRPPKVQPAAEAVSIHIPAGEPIAPPSMDDFLAVPAAVAAPAKPKTIDDVRSHLQTVLNMHGAEEARRVLAPFAARIPDVKPEDYDRFIAACEASVKASKK